jgi:hypothetical protein
MAWVWIDPAWSSHSSIVIKPWSEAEYAAPWYQWGIEYEPEIRSYIFVFGDSNTAEHLFSAAGATGRWQHVAFSYDGSYVRAYVDGAWVDSWSETMALVARGTPLRIAIAQLGSESLRGRIDDVRIYDRALDDAEIALARSSAVGP